MQKALGQNRFVGSSAGRGNLALVPWVDFGDDTPDNQDLRINLVYNFKADMSGVYLILRVHFYQPDQNKYGKYLSLFLDNKSRYMREFLDENYKLRDDLLYEVDLASNQNLPKLHSDATIVAKYYEKGNIPSTEELVDDINYFLELRKFLLENYTDDTQISADEWVTALEDDSVIDDKMFSILEIMYHMDDYRATTSQLVEKRQELGFIGEKSYNKTIVDNSKYVKEFLNKKTIYNEDGTENLWMRFFYGESVKLEKDGKQTREFQFKLKDELVEALGRIDRELDNEINEKREGEIMVDEKTYDSFYNYLIKNEYLFDKKTIENYLLSLKVKPFAILTGNSGTGKTKLSQLYAKYISGIEEKDLENEEYSNSDGYITVRAKTNYSSWANKGWTLNSEDFKDFLPFDEISKKIDFTVDGIEGRGTISFLIQLYYDSEVIKNYFNKLYQIDETSVVPLKIKCEDIKIFGTDSYLDNNEAIEIQQNSNKSAFNKRQWMLSKKFFDYLPLPFGFHHCNILVKGTESSARFRVMCKLTFENNKKLQNYLKKKDGKEVTLEIQPNSYNFDGFKSKMNCDKKLVKEGTGLHNKLNYKIIPVGANWTENRHIVGYYNVITNEYQDTPAYKLITQAEDSSEPHFLILDEMNLSHVERYFADFLSAIESGEKIPLYGEEELTLPQNLFIIGTVNVDETTYMFSPKVLDRANVIEFETYSALDYMKNKINLNAPNGNISYLEDPLAGNYIRDYGIDELRDFFNGVTVDGNPFWNILSEEIFKFQEILKESGFDFGFRVINEIVRFMAVAWEYEDKPDEFTNWSRYFDACIKQKLLPKLHGSEKIIGETLDKLYLTCLNSTIDNEEMAKYPESYKKLGEMREVLRKQRYVSFIN